MPLHEAVEAHHSVERIDGYSPSQWAFGRDKNGSGALAKEGDNFDVVKCTNQSYVENLSKRVPASKIIEDWVLKQQRARAAGPGSGARTPSTRPRGGWPGARCRSCAPAE